MFGGEHEGKATLGLSVQPGPGLFRNVRGMVVEDQLDCSVRRISRIEVDRHFGLNLSEAGATRLT